jgi:predicted ATPase
MVGLASALHRAALLAHLERNPAEVERYTSDLIELSTRHNFAYWLAAGAILRGWARSVSGGAAEGISWIESGIRDYRATGSIRSVPFYLRLKAEVLYLADRTPEALEAITQAEVLIERNEERWHYAELLRLRGVFLAAMGASKTQTEDSFCAAIRMAREQKAISLLKRAEASYAVYRGRKGKKAGDAEPEPGI